MTTFREIAEQIGLLVTEKDAAYGSAVQTAPKMLALLWPEGVPPTAYQDMTLLVRIWDKMMRIANKKDAFGESPYRDISGYGIQGAWLDEQPKPGDVRRFLERSIEICELLGAKPGEPFCKCGHKRARHAHIDGVLRQELLANGIAVRGSRPCDECPCAEYQQLAPAAAGRAQ